MGTTGRTIRRYRNRKLYDPTESRYVGLHEVAALIRSGEDVTVVDHVSGRDLTTATYALIILREQSRDGRIPAKDLERVIREGLPPSASPAQAERRS
jgi:polyhydroxyalkanoate synthesis repressor PhaR